MKKATGIIIVGLLAVTACVLYLLGSGVSLRSAVLIRPSIVDERLTETSQAVFARLFPEFQRRSLLVIGIDEPSSRIHTLVQNLKSHSERFLNKKIEIFDDDTLLPNAERIQRCEKSCWILTEARSTSDIAPMPSVLQLAGLAEKDRFTLSIIEFGSYDHSVIDECEKRKRLTLNCLRNLAIKEAGRRMNDPTKKYFFLRQYNDRDYFLFLQK